MHVRIPSRRCTCKISWCCIQFLGLDIRFDEYSYYDSLPDMHGAMVFDVSSKYRS